MCGIVRRFSQWWCPHQGQTITVPVVGQRPDSPDEDTTYCLDCGKAIAKDYTDDAGMEFCLKYQCGPHEAKRWLR